MPCSRDRRSSTSRLQPILAPRARSSQATLLDLSLAGLARGLGGAFPPGAGLRRYGELRPDIHLPTKGAPSAVTVRMTMAAARAGAPPPPLGDVVFLDPASFVRGSLRPRLPYLEPGYCVYRGIACMGPCRGLEHRTSARHDFNVAVEKRA